MHTAIGLMIGMYLCAVVMVVLNLAAFGVGIRVPFIGQPASSVSRQRNFFRSNNAPRNALGRWALRRRLV